MEAEKIKRKTQPSKSGAQFDLERVIEHIQSAGDKTLENDITNINSNIYDLEFDLDPLFKQMTLMFDIGTSNSLLFN